MRGPLPDPNRRRRNAPTIPSTALPAAGRGGDIPKVPAHIKLGTVGKAWWRWAWRTPEAGGWSDGQVEVVARRARLEDDLAKVRDAENHEPGSVVEVRLLKAMLEVDIQLGLTPKARAQLRWRVVADPTLETGEPETPEKPKRPPRRSNVRRLRAVDADAVAGA